MPVYMNKVNYDWDVSYAQVELLDLSMKWLQTLVISGLITQNFFSLHLSPTSLTLASIAFFFTLCARSSRYIASTRKVIVGDFRSVILESKNWRWASGNGVLGSKAGFFVEVEAKAGFETTRFGSWGTANTFSVGWTGFFWLARESSTQAETKVNGLMGYGVSIATSVKVARVMRRANH